MPELSLYNIDQITNDVKMQEIGFSHLFHDLVDHICCDVEYQMQQGMTFDEAYKTVKAKIGFRGLKKIQEDTLYVVDVKYRNMKKLMKITGVAGTILLGFAAIFKISHWPMAGVMITLGAFVLSFLFLPSALIVLWKETQNQKKLILFISAFIAGITFTFGMLFKIQHWPGAAIMIFIGLGAATFLFIPSLLFHLFRDKEKKHKRPLYVAGAASIIFYISGFWFKMLHWPFATALMLTGSFVLVIIIFPLFTRLQWKNETNVNARFIFMVIVPMLFILPGTLINLNVSRSYDAGFYKKIEKQDALISLQKELNRKTLTLYKDTLAYSGMNSIHSSANRLLSVLDKIEYNMVVIAEQEESSLNQNLVDLSASGKEQVISYETIKSPLHELPASLMLLPGCRAREILEKEVSDYKVILASQFGADFSKSVDPFLDLSEYIPGVDTQSFQHALLPNLISLSLLESAILFTESEALKQISNKNNLQ